MNEIKLLEKYTSHPLIRSLAQLIPFGIGSSIDILLTEKVVDLKKRRFEVLLDTLLENEVYLTEELITSEEFLHNYFKTVQIVINTRRLEKIKFISQLFLNYAVREMSDEFDEYEELLSILDMMSLRELKIVMLLREYENANLHSGEENDLQRADKFWNEFQKRLVEDLGIRKNEIDSYLIRLVRTGLYEIFAGVYLSYTGGKGKTTPLLTRLIAIHKEAEGR